MAKDKEPKDMKEKFEWVCPRCQKSGLAATRADARLAVILHNALQHAPKKKKGD
jgi:hypothetical protein